MWLCWFLSHTDVTYNDRRILPLFIFFPDMSGVRVVGLYARNSFVETKSVFVTLNNDCCRRGGSGGDAIELKGKRYWLITHSLLRDVVVSRLIEPHWDRSAAAAAASLRRHFSIMKPFGTKPIMIAGIIIIIMQRHPWNDRCVRHWPPKGAFRSVTH